MNTDNQSIILALDIGTNNTCGSYINPNTGRAEIIEVSGLRSVPSFFGYNNEGEEIIGKAAKMKFCDGISEVIGRAKFLVGKHIPRDAIKVYSEKCGTEIRFNQDGYCYFHLPKKGVDVSPSELYKRMINFYVSLLQSRHIGRAEKIRITVPASFDAVQRDLVKRVVEECGFESENISLLNEPSAAAYMYWHETKPTEGKFLVYDFGGGTFDISLVGVDNGKLEVLDYDGDPELGGCDIDETIANEYLTEIEGRNLPIIRREMSENVKRRIMGKLLLRCEESKIRLGEIDTPGYGGELVLENDELSDDDKEEKVEEVGGNEVAIINMADALYVKEDGGDDEESIEYEYEYEFTRESLIQISQPFIDKTIGLVRDLLNRNGLGNSDISSVIVVGGSSLLPSVRRSLEKIFHPIQILDTVPPKEVVSLGACYSLFEKYGLKERSTYSLGVEMKKKNHVQWLIPKNVPLPYQCDCTITTTDDYQTYIVTNLVQGKSAEVTTKKEKKLIRLGSIICDINAADKKKGEVSFDVTYIFESDGCVHVRIAERGVNEPIYDENVRWKNCNVCSKTIPHQTRVSNNQKIRNDIDAMLGNG